MKGDYIVKSSRDILQRMSNMQRYNNVVHAHEENVAEHSFYVATYTMAICHELHVIQSIANVAIKMALCHDIHETIISDIPHNIKARIPALGNICEQEESIYNTEHLEYVFSKNGLQVDENKVAHLIVDLADIMSVLQYAQHEVALGNKVFVEIEKGAHERIDDVCYKLDKMGVCGIDLIKKMIRTEE